MELYSGLDLHSRNTCFGVLNRDFKRVFKKRVSNNLDIILETLKNRDYIYISKLPLNFRFHNHIQSFYCCIRLYKHRYYVGFLEQPFGV
jgi:hypothetical protein